jgi:hypothetical protein
MTVLRALHLHYPHHFFICPDGHADPVASVPYVYILIFSSVYVFSVSNLSLAKTSNVDFHIYLEFSLVKNILWMKTEEHFHVFMNIFGTLIY